MFCWHVFGNISGGFCGIWRFLGNFAGPRLCEISEALFLLLLYFLWECTVYIVPAGLSKVAGSWWTAYLVSNSWLLCLAFLYWWCFFFNKISLVWPLTLTTQPSTLKLKFVTTLTCKLLMHAHVLFWSAVSMYNVNQWFTISFFFVYFPEKACGIDLQLDMNIWHQHSIKPWEVC